MFGSSEWVELLSVSDWHLIAYSVFPGSQQRWENFLVVTSWISILLFTGVGGSFRVPMAPGNTTLVSIQSIVGLCQTNQLYPRMVEYPLSSLVA